MRAASANLARWTYFHKARYELFRDPGNIRVSEQWCHNTFGMTGPGIPRWSLKGDASVLTTNISVELEPRSCLAPHAGTVGAPLSES
jgi:hypothetical protein